MFFESFVGDLGRERYVRSLSASVTHESEARARDERVLVIATVRLNVDLIGACKFAVVEPNGRTKGVDVDDDTADAHGLGDGTT